MIQLSPLIRQGYTVCRISRSSFGIFGDHCGGVRDGWGRRSSRLTGSGLSGRFFFLSRLIFAHASSTVATSWSWRDFSLVRRVRKLGSNYKAIFSPKWGVSCARSTKVSTAHNPKVGGSNPLHAIRPSGSFTMPRLRGEANTDGPAALLPLCFQ